MSSTASSAGTTHRHRSSLAEHFSLGDLLPRASDYARLPATWRRDVVAGLSVGVVALPLALAFGITTGLGAAAGLTAAIVGGLIAAVFGGSNVQVSGTSGAMAVVLVPLVARHGAGAVTAVGLLAGVMVLLAGVLRFGRLVSYLPWPVIEGFTLGVAVVMFLQQVPSALGVPIPEGENAAAVAAAAVGDALSSASLASLAPVLLIGLVIVAMVCGPRLHRAFPGSLVAVVLTTVVASLTGMDVATIGELPSSLPSLSLPELPLGDLGQYMAPAFTVAALAAIESLLSARVADGMADIGRHDPDRELFGQGLANVASSAFGGMPATGAIARTAVNVRAGAQTRLAAIVHSLLLVVVVLVGSRLVAHIPLAALAGVLMVTSFRMVDPRNVRAILRSTRSDAVVLALTAVATVATDLILAVQLGVALAALLALRNVARNTSLTRSAIEPASSQDEVAQAELDGDRIVVYSVDGALFFGAAQRFLAELGPVDDVRVVILHLPEVQVLDVTGAQAIGEITAALHDRGITVLFKGPRPEHLHLLRTVGGLGDAIADEHVFAELSDAIDHARLHASEGRCAAPAR